MKQANTWAEFVDALRAAGGSTNVDADGRYPMVEILKGRQGNHTQVTVSVVADLKEKGFLFSPPRYWVTVEDRERDIAALVQAGAQFNDGLQYAAEYDELLSKYGAAALQK